MTVAEVGSSGRGGILEIQFGHVEFEISIRHQRGAVKQKVG